MYYFSYPTLEHAFGVLAGAGGHHPLHLMQKHDKGDPIEAQIDRCR
jgi:hypothetical protein